MLGWIEDGGLSANSASDERPSEWQSSVFTSQERSFSSDFIKWDATGPLRSLPDAAAGAAQSASLDLAEQF